MNSKLFVVVTLILVCTFAMQAQEIHNFCGRCHKLHTTANPANTKHLIDYGGAGAGVSELCLSCHDHVLATDATPEIAPAMSRTFGVVNVLPAGDLYLASDGSGTMENGHTIVDSTTYGPGPDPTNGISPPGGDGGDVQSFGCVSCHYPHLNNAYNFRLLRKVIPDIGTGANFDTEAPATINDSGAANGCEKANLHDGATNGGNGNLVIDNTNRNVYRGDNTDTDKGGWSGWCGSCHGTYHNDSGNQNALNTDGWIRHPTNWDLQSGGFIPGTEGERLVGTGYTYLMPVDADGNAAVTNVGGGNYAATDRVFCLSCHYAHASDQPNAWRWDVNAAALAGPPANFETCNACHNKD